MNSTITAALVAVIALLGGFYGGFKYESGQVVASAANNAAKASTGTGTGAGTGSGRTFTGGNFAGGAGGGAGGGAFGGRGGLGTITNLTSTGFTLHSANGTDTKVTFASNATVRKTVDGALSDLTDNETVTVTGTRDSSGNLTATTITIVPAASTTPTAGG
jgi:hypothetical protein